jgi:hypothetical protein
MLDFILPVSLAFFAIFFLFLSINKKNYQKLVENNDEKFADKINNGLKICGYLLLICSLVWIVAIFI